MRDLKRAVRDRSGVPPANGSSPRRRSARSRSLIATSEAVEELLEASVSTVECVTPAVDEEHPRGQAPPSRRLA